LAADSVTQIPRIGLELAGDLSTEAAECAGREVDVDGDEASA